MASSGTKLSESPGDEVLQSVICFTVKTRSVTTSIKILNLLVIPCEARKSCHDVALRVQEPALPLSTKRGAE